MSSEFTSEMVLGQKDLDREHALLMTRLGNLAAALDGSGVEAAEAADAFADQLMAHLAAEEALMEETLYPERRRHKLAHELFVADFLQMRGELREKGLTPLVVGWVRTRIPEWLRFHIRVNDVPLAAHLARRRPQPGDTSRRKGDGRRLS